MKKYFIFFNLFLLYVCFIEKSEYIKDISSSKNLEKELENNEKSSGMLLIYSTWCHHCIEFSKTYVKLAKQYHNKLFFYAMSQKTDYEKKFKDVSGYPSIFFYKDGQFSQNKGSRSFDSLSKKINEELLIKCLKINYREIEKIYNNEYLKNDLSRNLLIGFFKDKDHYNIYDGITTNYLRNYLDHCYYCSDFESYINNNNNNTTIYENKILSFNKQKGNYSFYLDNNNPNIKNDYILFIHNNVINSYEDINNENKLLYLDFIKNKLCLVFVYNDIEKKNNYTNIANKLIDMNLRKEKKIFNILLFNKKVKYDKFKEMKENNTYLIDKKFKKIIELNNLDYIEDIIKKNNMKLNKEVENDINYIFDNSKTIYIDNYNIYKYLIFFSVIILAFIFLYKIFIKNNSEKDLFYTELIRQPRKNMKIEIV